MYLISNGHEAISDGSQARRAALEGSLFMAVAALVIFTPTLGLCNAMGQVWPLALMVGSVTAGTILGLLLHRKQDEAVAIKIPFTHEPNVPRTGTGVDLKKAA